MDLKAKQGIFLKNLNNQDLTQITELVTDKMVNSLTITGNPENCNAQLQKFRGIGIDLPIIQFNPTGDVIESFKLFSKTFFEGK